MGFRTWGAGSAGLAAAALLSLGAGRQPAPTRYTSGPLACAGFVESVRTRIRGESGTALVEDKAGRDGLLMVKATAVGDSLGIEAWYDSLAVWRATDAGRESPDVEGFLGGRYRGVLSPTGRYRPTAVPFVPDEVADVADLASVIGEFFPRIPTVELAPGREVVDSAGWKIRRLNDRRDGTEIVRRFEWNGTRRVGDSTAVADSLSVVIDQNIREAGELAWSARYGPLGWTRHLIINARIPARGGVKRGITSVIEQDITVNRRFELPGCQ